MGPIEVVGVVLIVWTLFSFAAGFLVGRAIEGAERSERPRRRR